MSHSPVTAEEQQQLERILYDYDVFDLRVNIVTVSHPNLREFYKDYFRSLEQIDAFADRLETWLEPGALLRETPKFFTPGNTASA